MWMKAVMGEVILCNYSFHFHQFNPFSPISGPVININLCGHQPTDQLISHSQWHGGTASSHMTFLPEFNYYYYYYCLHTASHTSTGKMTLNHFTFRSDRERYQNTVTSSAGEKQRRAQKAQLQLFLDLETKECKAVERTARTNKLNFI